MTYSPVTAVICPLEPNSDQVMNAMLVKELWLYTNVLGLNIALYQSYSYAQQLVLTSDEDEFRRN